MNTLILTAIRCSLMFLVPSVTYAISAQWDLDPISGDWNTATNWTPDEVPNGSADTATFGFSHTTDVSISANTEVNSIVFTSAATNPYNISASFDLTLLISGTGIINNSGIVQNFTTNGRPLGFTNDATAGNLTTFTNNPGVNTIGGGRTAFFNTSSAGSATFINKGFLTSTFFLTARLQRTAFSLIKQAMSRTMGLEAQRVLSARQVQAKPHS